MQYIAIWAPAIVAVLSTVAAGILAIAKVKKAVDTFKDDTTISSLKESVNKDLQENKEIKAELVEVKQELDVVIDQLTKIEHYRENK